MKTASKMLLLLLAAAAFSGCVTVKTWDADGNLIGKCRAVGIGRKGECVGRADGRAGRRDAPAQAAALRCRGPRVPG